MAHLGYCVCLKWSSGSITLSHAFGCCQGALRCYALQLWFAARRQHELGTPASKCQSKGVANAGRSTGHPYHFAFEGGLG